MCERTRGKPVIYMLAHGRKRYVRGTLISVRVDDRVYAKCTWPLVNPAIGLSRRARRRAPCPKAPTPCCLLLLMRWSSSCTEAMAHIHRGNYCTRCHFSLEYVASRCARTERRDSPKTIIAQRLRAWSECARFQRGGGRPAVSDLLSYPMIANVCASISNASSPPPSG